jgi:hypothetical protein
MLYFSKAKRKGNNVGREASDQRKQPISVRLVSELPETQAFARVNFALGRPGKSLFPP